MIRPVSDVTARFSIFFLALASGAVPLLSSARAAAADKTSLACIRAAEDGQAARDGGQLLRARELFAVCAARECPTVLRRDCTGWLEDARRQTPSVVVVARDTSGRDVVDAQVIVDGTMREPQLDGTGIELDPGPHVVRVQTAGVDPVEERVLLAAGEKNRTINVTFAFPRAAPPAVPAAPAAPPAAPAMPESSAEPPHGRGLPAMTFVLGGLGIAAFGVFGYFGIRGMLDADQLRSTCVPACHASDVDAVHTKLVIADVALGVGVVSVVAATWIGIHALASPAPVPAARSGAATATRSPTSWELQLAPRVGGMTGGVLLHF
jgi:hypothetical protein